MPAPVVHVLELVVGLVPPLGADVRAHPQPDPERLAAPRSPIGAASQLGGAHQCGGPLELLGGEQPQGVAHENGDAVTPVERAVDRVQHALAAADRERVRREPQVGLGLATAGG